MKKIAALLLFISVAATAQVKSKDVFDVARSGTVDEMTALIQKKKDTINAVNPSGFSPLILACYRGNAPVAEYLAKTVKDINYDSPSGTALAAATVKGNVAMVKILLENKANPDVKDATGMTPLLYAAQFDNKEMITLLLKYKANRKIVNNDGKSAMDFAVFNKSSEAEALLK